MNRKIILASGSPRRKELMGMICPDFEIRVSNAEEKADPSLSPAELVMSLARQKGCAIDTGNENELIVSADTVVELDGRILGKPHTAGRAKEMLKDLSGKTHRVFTGVYLVSGKKEICFYECTEVEFYSLTDEEIDEYTATGEPLDKAGAYGIQGKGCTLVKKINGDYYNVVGFPVARVKRALGEFQT